MYTSARTHARKHNKNTHIYRSWWLPCTKCRPGKYKGSWGFNSCKGTARSTADARARTHTHTPVRVSRRVPLCAINAHEKERCRFARCCRCSNFNLHVSSYRSRVVCMPHARPHPIYFSQPARKIQRQTRQRSLPQSAIASALLALRVLIL